MRLTIITIMAVLLSVCPCLGQVKIEQGSEPALLVGPFVDDADGVTPVDNLNLAGMDIAKLVKSDGSEVDLAGRGADFAETTLGGAGDSEGWYLMTLDDATYTDTTTLGRLVIMFHDSADFLPVWLECEVVPADVFGGLVDGSEDLICDAENSVWDADEDNHNTADSYGQMADETHAGICNDMRIDTVNHDMEHYDDAGYGGSILYEFDLKDETGSDSSTNIYRRERQ